VPLEAIKTDGVLQTMPLVKQSRLSVTPLSPAQAERLLQLGGG
jgi:predicted RNA-binding protein with PUA-like domain